MSLALRIAITAPDLSGWRKACDPRELHEELGNEYARLLVEHFRAKNAKPNARGFPRSNFWNGVAGATAFDSADEKGATVKVSDPYGRPMLHRYFGGVIRPGAGRKALALPVRPEAAGVLPRSGAIPDLFVLRSKSSGRAFLARRELGALRLYFRLVPFVKQAADPTALPPESVTQDALTAHAETFLRLKLES